MLQSANHSFSEHNQEQSEKELAPCTKVLFLQCTSNGYSDTGMPSLGACLGEGKTAEVFQAKHDPESVIKKLKYWKLGFQTRFVEFYRMIESDRPFEPSEGDDQFLYTMAMEFRNLKAVGELQAPEPHRFCGWFQLKYIRGAPICETPGYKHFPFTVPFQVHVRRAFHLVVDRLEWTVRQYGIEHRWVENFISGLDAHHLPGMPI